MKHLSNGFPFRGPGVLLAMALLIPLSGCQRRYYRNKVDKESADILSHKALDPAWALRNYHVYPDPRSRFAEPGNPDKPPMPPDDPAAAALSPNPQKPGKAGIAWTEGTGYIDLLALWNRENRAKIQAEKAKKEAEEKEKKQKTGESEEQSPILLTLGVPIPMKNGKPVELASLPEDWTRKQRDKEQAIFLAAYKEEQKEDKKERKTSKTKYRSPLELKHKKDPYLLNLEQSLLMALINSRDFQDRREDLYLQSLPVTVERFAFTTQFFAMEEIIRERTGSQTVEGPRNRWIANTNFGFTKLFTTGALLLFQFANQTVVEMLGNFNPKTTSTSQINLDLIQPLLRGGGKAVTLEPLTLVERNLLYEIRDYARFRKEFYVSISAGSGLGGAQIGSTRFRNRPQTFGATGRVGGAQIGVSRGGISGLPASTIGGASPSGYLQTIVNAALLLNDRKNVKALEETLAFFEGIKEGGAVSQLQIDQVEQQLLDARNSVFDRERSVLDTLDQFKIQLGLPITIDIELDQEPINPQIEQLSAFEQVFADLGVVREQAALLLDIDEPSELRSRLRDLATSSKLVENIPFQEEFPRRWDRWAEMTEAELRAQRRAILEQLRELKDTIVDLEVEGKEPPDELLDRIAVLEFELQLGTFEASLRRYEVVPWQRIGSILAGSMVSPLHVLPGAALRPENFQRVQVLSFRAVFNSFIILLLEARNERLEKARDTWPELPILLVEGTNVQKEELREAQEVVARAALTHRLDLMNARAQLVDSWRQIKIAANSLLGTFNVEYHLRSNTPPGLARPFAFDGSRTRHQLTFNMELPLVRIVERNNYRASLISWQRQRRLMMLTQDTLALNARTQLRQLRVLVENYEIQKRAVEIAYLRVENARDTFREPPTPTSESSAAQSAALTQQLLGAQGQLIRAQNGLISLWVQYLSARMQFYRDLGMMHIDSRGVWIDDPAIQNYEPSANETGK